MTASDLRELFVTVLVGVVGGSPDEWQRTIGKIDVHPLSTHPRCNWTIEPAGGPAERTAVREAADVICAEHPYIDKG